MHRIQLDLVAHELSRNQLARKFQGWLMGAIPNEMASDLHQNVVNPYSIGVTNTQIQLNCLTDAFYQAVSPLIQAGDLKLEGTVLQVKQVSIIELNQASLADIFYQATGKKQIMIHFASPTSFKQQNDYVIFPTPRLIFQSLMTKYAYLVESSDQIDLELLDEITRTCKITSYKLHTHYYSIHGKKIPAFRGQIRLTVNGADSLYRYLLMLVHFGEYTGVGIKASMGMGMIQVLKTSEKTKGGTHD